MLSQLEQFIEIEYNSFIGKKIVQIRPLRKTELDDLAWHCSYSDIPIVIIFEDGQALIPSSDPEANGPGFLITADVPQE